MTVQIINQDIVRLGFTEKHHRYFAVHLKAANIHYLETKESITISFLDYLSLGEESKKSYKIA